MRSVIHFTADEENAIAKASAEAENAELRGVIEDYLFFLDHDHATEHRRLERGRDLVQRMRDLVKQARGES